MKNYEEELRALCTSPALVDDYLYFMGNQIPGNKAGNITMRVKDHGQVVKEVSRNARLSSYPTYSYYVYQRYIKEDGTEGYKPVRKYKDILEDVSVDLNTTIEDMDRYEQSTPIRFIYDDLNRVIKICESDRTIEVTYHEDTRKIKENTMISCSVPADHCHDHNHSTSSAYYRTILDTEGNMVRRDVRRQGSNTTMSTFVKYWTEEDGVEYCFYRKFMGDDFIGKEVWKKIDGTFVIILKDDIAIKDSLVYEYGKVIVVNRTLLSYDNDGNLIKRERYLKYREILDGGVHKSSIEYFYNQFETADDWTKVDKGCETFEIHQAYDFTVRNFGSAFSNTNVAYKETDEYSIAIIEDPITMRDPEDETIRFCRADIRIKGTEAKFPFRFKETLTDIHNLIQYYEDMMGIKIAISNIFISFDGFSVTYATTGTDYQTIVDEIDCSINNNNGKFRANLRTNINDGDIRPDKGLQILISSDTEDGALEFSAEVGDANAYLLGKSEPYMDTMMNILTLKLQMNKEELWENIDSILMKPYKKKLQEEKLETNQ